MTHLFINSLAASAGGGLTYIRNVIPHLAHTPGLRVTVAMAPGLREEFRDCGNLAFVEVQASSLRRFWYEQLSLPSLIRQRRADVLLCTGNFAVRNSPVPQILLSRNSLYRSRDFYRDLRSRHEYRAWLDTHLRALMAKRSIRWADATVAPSAAFAEELNRWTGVTVLAIPHGFDPDAFTRDPGSLPAEIEDKLRSADGSLKLLFVSHYNYYRNFETLIRALPLLRDRCGGRKAKLLLTCKLEAGQNPGAYRTEAASRLVRDLGVGDSVVELGAVPYGKLHRLYRRADIYVSPSYAETFAHPLVEAMASGLPVVASDLPVHKEICRDAAVYFPRFSPQELSDCIAEIATSPDTAARLSACGRARSTAFRWRKHVGELLSLANSLLAART